MNAETLSAAAGVALSLGFSYLPGLQDWFSTLSPTHKRLVMLALLVIAAVGSFGLGCLGRLDVTCDQEGGWLLLRALLAAVVANQSTYAISPQAGRRAA